MKISIRNTGKIQAALDAVQEKKRARLATPENIADCIAYIEQKLQGMLYKKDWVGLKFVIDPCAENHSRHHMPPDSTVVTIERGASEWYMVDVKRAMNKPKSQQIYPLNIRDRINQMKEFIDNSVNWKM